MLRLLGHLVGLRLQVSALLLKTFLRVCDLAANKLLVLQLAHEFSVFVRFVSIVTLQRKEWLEMTFLKLDLESCDFFLLLENLNP